MNPFSKILQRRGDGLEGFYDISVKLGAESIDHPGAAPYSRKEVWALEKGHAANLSEIRMTTHTGTHIDAPSHFIPQGKSIDQYSAADFILPACVVHVEDQISVKPVHMEGVRLDPSEAVLFRTQNSTRGISKQGPLLKDYVFLSSEAAEVCVQKRAPLVGIDYVTIDRHGDRSCAVHRRLLENGILILEGIHLGGVPEGKYTLVCLPLNISGAEASPARAVLFRR